MGLLILLADGAWTSSLQKLFQHLHMLPKRVRQEVLTAGTERERFFHWPCRYGGMFVIGMAYRGTANNSMIQKLLHFAVSDVSDDVRRAAVINLGFLLLSVPDQCPPIVALLAESYNAHVRYGGCPLPSSAPQQHPQLCCWRHCNRLRGRACTPILALILVVIRGPYPAMGIKGSSKMIVGTSAQGSEVHFLSTSCCASGSAGSDGRQRKSLRACRLA